MSDEKFKLKFVCGAKSLPAVLSLCELVEITYHFNVAVQSGDVVGDMVFAGHAVSMEFAFLCGKKSLVISFHDFKE